MLRGTQWNSLHGTGTKRAAPPTLSISAIDEGTVADADEGAPTPPPKSGWSHPIVRFRSKGSSASATAEAEEASIPRPTGSDFWRQKKAAGDTGKNMRSFVSRSNPSTSPSRNTSKNSTGSTSMPWGSFGALRNWGAKDFSVTYSVDGQRDRKHLRPDAALSQFALCAKVAGLRGKITGRTLELLKKCKECNPPSHRDLVNHLRANFQLYVFRAAHLVLTSVIWYHHFYIKLTEKEKAVPEGAPNWTWKRFVPSVEFGTMHAILFQLALIPLTMCRFSLAFLSTTPLSYVIPFEHAVDFHIFLGYVFSMFMVLTVALFLTFFGKVCVDFNAGRDPADTCKNFTSEIMLTGYAILLCTLVVLASSFFRRKLKFEWFYVLHHFALIMMLIAALHTLDDEFRKGTPVGRNRSQAFKWFTTSLIIYMGDRLWQHLSASRSVPIKSAALAKDESVLILTLKKPEKFTFEAGQHVFLQIPVIDLTYHPFSISSAPSSNDLSFIMEVKKRGSWTHKLAMLSQVKTLDDIKVNVMGAFGTSVAGAHKHSEIVAIGTGTGIVPMISLVLEHAHRVKLLQKTTWQDAEKDNVAPKQPLPLGMCLLQTMERWQSLQQGGLQSPYVRLLARRARWVRIHNVIELLASFWFLFELYLFASTLSFAGLPDKAPAVKSQGDQLRFSTLVAVSVYALFFVFKLFNPQRYCVSQLAKALGSLDAVLLLLSAIVLACWWENSSVWMRPTLGQQALRSFLSLWRLVSLWSTSPANQRLLNDTLASRLLGVSKFTLVWSCPSAHLVAGYLAVFEDTMSVLTRQLGHTKEGLRNLVEIRIHCTDKNEERVAQLKRRLATTKYAEGFVYFGRANLEEVVRGTMEHQLKDGLNGSGGSHSLVTFCGSRQVANLLRSSLEHANNFAESLGFHNHRMGFREEFYGVGR